MKAKLVLCFVLTLTLGVGMAQAAYLTHTGSADPTTESWTWVTQELVAPDFTAGNDGSDYWGMAGDASEGGGYNADPTSAELLSDWQFTAKLKVVSNVPVEAEPQVNVCIQMLDNYTYLNTRFGEDTHTGEDPANGVWQFQNASAVWMDIEGELDTSQWHRYDIVFDPVTPGSTATNDMYYFKVDGSEVTSKRRNQIRQHSAGPSFFWGDSSNFSTGESLWNYVAFQIPEPVTLALLGLGGVVALLRRRRR